MSNHGGHREGAGAPVTVEAVSQVGIRLPEKLDAWINEIVAEQGVTRSEAVRRVLQAQYDAEHPQGGEIDATA